MNPNTALTIFCSVGILAAGAATAATSAERKFHAGVAVGNSSVDGRAMTPSTTLGIGFQLPTSLPIDTLPFKGDDTAWSAFLGYSATQYVGVELGYWNHGTFDSRFFGPDPATLGIEELYFGATLRYPLGHGFALTGSAGISRAHFAVDGSLSVLVVDTPIFPSLPILPPSSRPSPGIYNLPLATPPDKTGGYWKVGLNWRFTDALEAGLSYGKRELQVLQVETAALSLSYAF